MDILIQHWRRDDGLQKWSFQVANNLHGGQLSLGADVRPRTTGETVHCCKIASIS